MMSNSPVRPVAKIFALRGHKAAADLAPNKYASCILRQLIHLHSMAR